MSETIEVPPENYTGMVERTDGSRIWYVNGNYHREDGPAYEGSNGTKRWFRNGCNHREDGPAFEGSDGQKEWWLDDKHVYSNGFFLYLKGNYIVVARGIQTNKMFGKLKLTHAKLLTAQGTVYQFDNLPGFTIGEGNE